MPTVPEGMTVFDLDHWMTYLDFVVERHLIWDRRQAGVKGPWTTDPYLASKKFTNVFRILDPGSQFVLTDLYGDTEADLQDYLYRAFLYRHTGRVEAWQWLPLALGRYPLAGDGESILEAWKEYRGPGVYKANNRVRPSQPEKPHAPGVRGSTQYARSVFTGAYQIHPQSQVPGTDKMVSIVELAERLYRDGVFDAFLRERSPSARFKGFVSQKGVGNFMSMQVLTDWGYLDPNHDENAFVVAGPGAVKGAALLCPGASPESVIREARKRLLEEPGCPMLEGRPPSLMDVQNTLCEYSKLARYLNSPPGAAYNPAHPGPQPLPVLPEHWR